jgi:hypothetical protein
MIQKAKFQFKAVIYPATVLALSIFLLGACTSEKANEEIAEQEGKTEALSFSYADVTGIGKDSVYNRRDPSDVIRVGDKYYVWYSRMNSPIRAGYWATIWYATSEDEGYTWQEQGMALGLGEEGEFDSHSVFTPNILAHEGKYYLYYTAVQPTPGNAEGAFENNSVNDFTAIGLAVADSPDGPFVRIANNPILEVSQDTTAFDSYRVDDASLLVKDEKIWMYYKGRCYIDGKKGPGRTKMGVAVAEHPEGPYQKHEDPILDRSHEVLIWLKDGGVASLASISSSINFASDGINFSPIQQELTNIPTAPGLYRPHLEDGNPAEEIPGWGISMKQAKGEAYLLRYEINKQ